MILNPTRFIEEVKAAISGNFCSHEISKRVKLMPEIGGGKWVSGYKKVCVQCRKIVKTVKRDHAYVGAEDQ